MAFDIGVAMGKDIDLGQTSVSTDLSVALNSSRDLGANQRTHSQGLWKRGHLMKMCWIVVGPHILWVQASNNTNLSRPMEMTFGQVSDPFSPNVLLLAAL